MKGIFLAAGGLSSYLLLHDFASALAVNLFAGATGTIASVACTALAAKHTPDGSEGFSYALLLAIQSLAGQVSANLGSLLYVYVLGSNLHLLILVAFVFCLLHLALLRILRWGRQG